MKTVYQLPTTESREWDRIVPPLTLRQRKIIKCLAEGHNNDQTAELCGISRRSFYLETETMRITYECRTNIEMVIKIRDILMQKIIAQ